MPKFTIKPIYTCFFIASLPIWLGCTDGPWYQLKRANPIYRKQWAADRELGPTYEDRINEARLVKQQLPKMSDEEQRKWLTNLEQLYANDPSPDMRREAVLAMALVPDPRATVLLQKAANDESEKVRLSVCQSLSSRSDPESLALLGKLAQTDESSSVKVAAVKSMANYQGEEAKKLLAQTIQDRSPALQYQSSLSLAKVTGEDFGGDVAKWRSYLNGEPVEKAEISLAERMSSIMSINR